MRTNLNLKTMAFVLSALMFSVSGMSQTKLSKKQLRVMIEKGADYEDSKHLISMERSAELYANYNTKLKPVIEEVQKKRIKREDNQFDGTQYLLINIDTLKAYIKFLDGIEAKNSKNGKITGIALMFGAKGDKETLIEKPYFNKAAERNNPKYVSEKNGVVEESQDIRGRLSVFMTPTYRDNSSKAKYEKEKHIPFYITPTNEKVDKYVGKYTSLLDYVKKPIDEASLQNLNKAQRGNYEAMKKAGNNKYIFAAATSLSSDELCGMPPPAQN